MALHVFTVLTKSHESLTITTKLVGHPCFSHSHLGHVSAQSGDARLVLVDIIVKRLPALPGKRSYAGSHTGAHVLMLAGLWGFALKGVISMSPIKRLLSPNQPFDEPPRNSTSTRARSVYEVGCGSVY